MKTFNTMRLQSKQGSALIWAIAVALILTIILAAGLTLVQRQQNMSVQQHIDNQSYFSAMSVNKAFMEWLNGASSSVEFAGNEENTQKLLFISKVLEQPADEDVEFWSINTSGGADSDNFSDLLGDVVLYASRNADQTVITIKTIAYYAGTAATVKGVISNEIKEWEEGGGYIGDNRVQVPDPPEVGKDYTINQTISSGTIGTVNGAVAVTGTVTANGSSSADTIIVRNGAVLNLTGTGGAQLRFNELIIEPGGIVQVNHSSTAVAAKNNSLKFNTWNDASGAERYDNGPIIYIMPGGKLTTTSNAGGSVSLDCIAYLYAWPPAEGTFDTKPNITPAIDFHSGTNSVSFRSVVIQKANDPAISGYSDEFPPSFSAIVGNIAKMSISSGYAIHAPVGYAGFTLANKSSVPANILSRSCNHVGDGNPRYFRDTEVPGLDPFCPHFLALYEPPIPMRSDTWTLDGYGLG